MQRRGGVTVYLEFPDQEIARRVKHRLNECDIYSGCCTLKIEYARLSNLNVGRNDESQWDFVGSGTFVGGAFSEFTSSRNDLLACNCSFQVSSATH